MHDFIKSYYNNLCCKRRDKKMKYIFVQTWMKELWNENVSYIQSNNNSSHQNSQQSSNDININICEVKFNRIDLCTYIVMLMILLLSIMVLYVSCKLLKLLLNGLEF